jgi:hypothetical protein
MPHGLQVINAYNQDLGGTTAVALTYGTGDSGTFFNVPQGSVAWLGECWAVDDATKASIYLTASRFHDQQFGIRGSVPAGSTLAPASAMTKIFGVGIDQPIYPSDVMTIWAAGADNDKVNATVVVYYEDIPGIAARMASFEEVRSRGWNQVGIKTLLTPGSGNWGTGVALNSSDNRLHANTDYAVLGFNANLPLSAVGISGIDTGNLRTGGPVLANSEHDENLFVDFARAYNAPLIPIINSNNAGSTFLYAAGVGSTQTEVDVMLVELDRRPAGF